MASYTLNINNYLDHIELDDFIDYLISQKYLNERDEIEVWLEKQKSKKIDIILSKLRSHAGATIDNVLTYLKQAYPLVEENAQNKQDFQAALVRGGFPKLPPNNIKRTSHAERVRTELENLNYGDKLVIHGMIGAGKSCLVNEVLNDMDFIRRQFNNIMFWINLGEHSNTENILIPMWKLYSSSILLTSIPPISHCPDDIHKMRELLKMIFMQKNMSNALLVLDKVSNKEVLSAFDIGSKTVITTQFKQVVPQNYAKFIQVQSAFSEKESLTLFSKALECDKLKYEDIAIEINEICKGHPSSVGAIGSFLNASKEESLDRPEIWTYIRRKMIMGQYEFDSCNKNPSKKAAIQFCVERLSEERRQYYYDLAIFPQDVNIRPEVLQILWGIDEIYDIRSIMNEFASLSLIQSYYHTDCKTYIYGVHDLYLNYLKEVTKDRQVELHMKFINALNIITGGDYRKLPNDNYTLQFIGYHLKESGQTDKFSYYFDLKFLEAKIRAAGYADVIRDMDTYKDCICNNDESLKLKWKQYRDFVKNYGSDIFVNDKTDVIQYALQDNKESCVYNDAVEYATNDNLGTYFNLHLPKDKPSNTKSFCVEDDITAAAYVGNCDHILIGTSRGSIKYYVDNRIWYSLEGHTNAIIAFHLNPSKTHLLSISKDETVRLWELRKSNRRSFDLNQKVNTSSQEFIIGSPKEKQHNWINIYTEEVQPKSIVYSLNTNETLLSAAFSPDFEQTKMIATGTTQGRVLVWNTSMEILCTSPARGLKASCILFDRFVNNEITVLVTCSDTILILSLVQKIFNYQLEYKMSLNLSEDLMCIFLRRPSFTRIEIIAIGERMITVWDPTPTKKYEVTMRNTIVCATLTSDYQYLLVGTNNNCVNIWDPNKFKVVDELKNNRGFIKSLDTFYDENNSVHILLIGSDRKTIQQCQIRPKEEEVRNTHLPVFSSLWTKTNKPLTAIINSQGQIKIYHGYVLIGETEIVEHHITFTTFWGTDRILYGLDEGSVYMFNIKTKKNSLYTKFDGPITYLQAIDSENVNNGLVLVTSGNNVKVLLGDGTILEQSFTNPISFYRKYDDFNDFLFIIQKNRVSMWDLYDNSVSMKYLFKPNVSTITANFCSNKKYLAITTSEDEAYTLNVFKVEDDSFMLIFNCVLPKEPCSSCFSFNGELLAVGLVCGDIKLWNLTDKFRSTSLHLHDTAVEYLLFAQGLEPILVSLGDQIAWWNLSSFLEKQKLSNGLNNNLNKLKLENGNRSISKMDLGYWANKKSSKSIPNLLACIKLHDQYAKFVSASEDFTSFLIVDDKGKIYIIESMKPAEVY